MDIWDGVKGLAMLCNIMCLMFTGVITKSVIGCIGLLFLYYRIDLRPYSGNDK